MITVGSQVKIRSKGEVTLPLRGTVIQKLEYMPQHFLVELHTPYYGLKHLALHKDDLTYEKSKLHITH